MRPPTVGLVNQGPGGTANLISVGNTNMTFNLEAGSAIHGANESSQMSDVTGSGADDGSAGSNQFSANQQMILNGGGEDGNSDLSKKIYKAKRFKP